MDVDVGMYLGTNGMCMFLFCWFLCGFGAFAMENSCALFQV